MIIGIDASRANIEKKTGTEWYAYHIINELIKLSDQKNQFILYSKEPLRDSLSKLPDNFTNKVLKWPPVFLWTQIRLAIEMLISKPDVLFVPAHTVPLICPKKTITTLHDIGFEEHPELYSTTIIGPSNAAIKVFINAVVRMITLGKYGATELDYHRWSARLALKKSSTIVTVSHFSMNKIQTLLKPKDIEIIPIWSGYNPSFKKINDTEQINSVKLKYKLHSPYILYIGRVEEKKNTLRLVQGFQDYMSKSGDKNILLVLAGNSGFGSQKIDRFIIKEQLQSRILRLGWVPDDDLPLLLNGAESFIFPSLYEGFGIPIIEAMACGTSVLASDIEPIREVGGDAIEYFDPHSVPSISESIGMDLSNPDDKISRIKSGLKRKDKFSWAVSSKKILTLLKK